MTEISRFFDHIDGDRTYNADDFAEYFRQILTTGVMDTGDNLRVYTIGTDRIARIKVGKAWIEGYFYKLTEELELQLDEAHGTYDRIDRIVLRLDKNTEARNIRAFIKKGEATASPIAPPIIREGNIYEISLAQILIIHNTTAIPTGNVTDERLDTEVCGITNMALAYDEYALKTELGDINDVELPTEIKGKPLTEMAKVNFTQVVNGKNKLEIAVNDKGGRVNKVGDIATFDELDVGIRSIELAKGNAVRADVLSGKTFSSEVAGVEAAGTMPNRGAINTTLTLQGQQTTIAQGYHSGSGIVKASISNLIASNIRQGANVGGIMGTFEGYARYATGVVWSKVGDWASWQAVEVTNLDFRPDIVIVVRHERDDVPYGQKINKVMSIYLGPDSMYDYDDYLNNMINSDSTATTEWRNAYHSTYVNGFKLYLPINNSVPLNTFRYHAFKY